MYKIMTAGPTQVRENVMAARSKPFPNPDIDPEFYDFYRETCAMLSRALHTQNQAFILGGEGILGLEAACASLTEPGDRVLVIDNGIFGKGFADFVKIYEGVPVLYSTDYRRPVDPEALKKYLDQDHAFKYATVVHCDTPSGVLNDVETISRILDSYGILTVADSVAGMFGEPLDLSKSAIDILCGGSQKALSCPPGLTMLWVSERAFRVMDSRKTPVRSFYASIPAIRNYYRDQWFPYTMPASDIMGLRQALDNFFADPDVYQRHARIANAVRRAVTQAGLSLYLEEGMSNTVTVICVPEGITDQVLIREMAQNYGILISGCFDVLAGKVVRIGHMGESCNTKDVADTLSAMQHVLEAHGIALHGDMRSMFLAILSQ